MNIFVRVKGKNTNTGNLSLSKSVVEGYSDGLITGLTVAEEDSVKESYYGKDLHALMKSARSVGSYYLAKRLRSRV